MTDAPTDASTGPSTGDPTGDTSPVRYRVEGDVGVINFDDGKANALGFGAIKALNAALDRAQADEVKAVAIIGRPGKFSAGFDLKVMTSGAENARSLLEAGAELGLRIFMFSRPVVLGVTGHALAMGGILTTCSDWRVAADGPFKLGLNEVAIGMPVPVFGVELGRNRLSKQWFDRCINQAYLCSPIEAVEAGFVDEVVDADEVADRTLAKAAELAAYVHPAPFRLTRTNCRGTLADELRESLTADLELFDVAT